MAIHQCNYLEHPWTVNNDDGPDGISIVMVMIQPWWLPWESHHGWIMGLELLRMPSPWKKWQWFLPGWSGWWLSQPSEKYESQLGWLFPIYGKIKKCSKPPTSYMLQHPLDKLFCSAALLLTENLSAKDTYMWTSCSSQSLFHQDDYHLVMTNIAMENPL